MDPVPFSQARARLPELVHRVARNAGEVVRIQHRDLDQDVALVSMRHLEILEERLAELRDRVGPAFRLEGTLSTSLEDDVLDASMSALLEGTPLPGEEEEGS